jgi:hypothetical protein
VPDRAERQVHHHEDQRDPGSRCGAAQYGAPGERVEQAPRRTQGEQRERASAQGESTQAQQALRIAEVARPLQLLGAEVGRRISVAAPAAATATRIASGSRER